MRAIIIDDKDARALLDQLRLEQFEVPRSGGTIANLAASAGVPDAVLRQIVSDVHRRFHYVVTGWLQEQGASTIR